MPTAPDSSMAAAARPGLLVVVGTTGVGKTKLGVDLARALGGEVINADVMQMYRGPRVATAKVTEEEALGVPHHLMSFLDPEDAFSPHEFRRRADDVIADIRSRGHLPIVVGGTMYYIQSLLWDHLIPDAHCENTRGGEAAASGSDSTSTTSATGRVPASNDDVTASLWNQLLAVDADMARALHPNNTRKIARSLEIFHRTGRTHSDLIREQHAEGGGVAAAAKLRYDRSSIVWLRADRDILRERLDRRVDRMMADGLADEISALQRDMLARRRSRSDNDQQQTGPPPPPFDPSKGVFQSIGFKEFDEFLALLRQRQVLTATDGGLSEGEGITEEAEKTALQAGVERLKVSTKRYARKQLGWIRNRLVNREVPVHMFDTTVVDDWDTAVLLPALASARHSLGLSSADSDGDAAVSAAAQDAARRVAHEHKESNERQQRKLEARRKRKKAESARRHARNEAVLASLQKKRRQSGAEKGQTAEGEGEEVGTAAVVPSANTQATLDGT